ncbi:TPA: ead/Ea22-like family protein [Klebsiella quasipneumoniae subsp. quasipneumoniae]|nr:ead/Ea22-like family protein [Klebsiella quasipneumoniae subsp. quasipneumoniae]
MTDITELAQRNELLIANGQQTADLLRHLADNEIDSDYFAVVSECESYGKETDAEISITEFALRAAGYVDALVEALEKAQAAERRWHRVASRIHEQACESDVKIDELEAIRAAAEKLVRCKGRYHSEQNYRALAALFGVTTPDLPPLEHENVHYGDTAEMEIEALRQRIAELESRTVKLPKLKMLEDYLAEVAIEERKQILVGVKLEFHRALAAAGIKVEAE